MGRPFRDVAVVKAYDANAEFVAEEVIPIENYRVSGCIFLNSAALRAARGIRFISLRVFDDRGHRVEQGSFTYNLRGERVPGLHRRVDGTIIEDPYWV